MAAVLLMVGRGQEAPDIVKRLLDLEATPRKPQYTMAPEEPLLLYACDFDGVSFRRTQRAAEGNTEVLTATLERHLVTGTSRSVCTSYAHRRHGSAPGQPQG
jgi:tRNA pseudouridine38/39 synthase